MSMEDPFLFLSPYIFRLSKRWQKAARQRYETRSLEQVQTVGKDHIFPTQKKR